MITVVAMEITDETVSRHWASSSQRSLGYETSMATPRLTMSKTREILRLKWLLKRSHRQVARSLSVSAGEVGSVLIRATKADLANWGDVAGLDDGELDQRSYGQALESTRSSPDCAWIHIERRKPGVSTSAAAYRISRAAPE